MKICRIGLCGVKVTILWISIKYVAKSEVKYIKKWSEFEECQNTNDRFFWKPCILLFIIKYLLLFQIILCATIVLMFSSCTLNISAKLIIVDLFQGSLPKCTTNIGPNGFVGENDCRHPIDEIHSSCSIEYAGNSVPNMRWMITSGQDTVQAQPITSVSGKTVSSEWGFMATTSMNEASVIWFSTQSALTKWTSAPIKTLCQFN